MKSQTSFLFQVVLTLWLLYVDLSRAHADSFYNLGYGGRTNNGNGYWWGGLLRNGRQYYGINNNNRQRQRNNGGVFSYYLPGGYNGYNTDGYNGYGNNGGLFSNYLRGYRPSYNTGYNTLYGNSGGLFSYYLRGYRVLGAGNSLGGSAVDTNVGNYDYNTGSGYANQRPAIIASLTSSGTTLGMYG